MFTMAKIKDGGTYLERHLVANDYYSENETVVGMWVGKAAARLGVTGEIRPKDSAFENLRQNRCPDGQRLTPRDHPERVKFYDFQCSAQKSVSIMAVTLGDTRLLAAHDRSAAYAFAELERFAARQANTPLTRGTIRTGNVAAAAFRHTASRALDPQVRTHFVTANATYDPKIRCWRALTEFEMVSAIRYAGKVYQNEMARSCRTLGYGIEEVRDRRGVVTGFEITGVSPEIRQRFSKRRADIELGIQQFQKSHGREPTSSEIHAITVATRSSKLAEVTTPEVLAAQRAQLSPEELELLHTVRSDALDKSRDHPLQHGLAREEMSLSLASAHLFERRSVARGHEILAEALNQNLGYLNLPKLAAEAQKTGLIGLTQEAWLHEHFATPGGLALEQGAVAFVDASKGRCDPLGPPRLSMSPRLSPEQRDAAAAVLASKDQVVSFRGAAGAGKTTTLKEIWREIGTTGVLVFICAPTSSAADTLRKEGLPATTLSDFLKNTALREPHRLRNAVLIVDESGLTSNRQGAALLRVAADHNARILFLGDTRQHSSVEAGDFLRVLETHSTIHKVELGAIRRQEYQAYREAIGCMAKGAPRLGLERLDALGWIKEAHSRYLCAAAENYVRLATDPAAKVLGVTPTWQEQAAFTREVRARLRAAGQLKNETLLTSHASTRWTQAQMRNPANYCPNMVITFHRAHAGFGEGESAVVSHVQGGRVFVHAGGSYHSIGIDSGAFTVSNRRGLEVAEGDRILIRANDRQSRFLNGEILSVARIRGDVLHFTDGRSLIPTALAPSPTAMP